MPDNSSLPPVVDTHAHLTSPELIERLDDVLLQARQAGLVRLSVIALDLASSELACRLAAEHPDFLYASVGVHPNYAGAATDDQWAQIEQLARTNPGVRALGETGLDLYWDDTPFPVQQDYFARHIELSYAIGLPLVIHQRETAAEMIDQLRPYAATRGPLRGVLHSFTGDADNARACLELGLYISFAGMLTFKKSDELRDVARLVPADRLLVETDSPYLSPEPFRGKRPNQPDRVVHTLRVLAECRGQRYEDLAIQTTENAFRLFGLAQ